MSQKPSRSILPSAIFLVVAVAISIGTAIPLRAQVANDCDRFHDPRYVYKAYIKSVYDGDTMTVDIDLGFRVWLHDEPLRLWGINTPEVKGEEKEAGLAVRDLVRSWIPDGSEVLIRTLKTSEGVDRTGSFHRYLAIVCPLSWSESINARLIREGKAEIDAPTQKERKVVLEYYERKDSE
jgi:micrococcal nuclease